MHRIGITGSIATGKSTVLKAFADLGVPVFSADEAVAELYEGDAVAPVEALFPGVSHNGRIDRTLLSQRLAADPEGFKRLEAVVHPLVRARIARFMDEAEKAGHALAVVEVPLLVLTPVLCCHWTTRGRYTVLVVCSTSRTHWGVSRR